jgi:hypothetical protein
MTQIILRTTVWKEDTAGIADKRTNGGIAVSGSAIGPAYVRIPIRSGFENRSLLIHLFKDQKSRFLIRESGFLCFNR